MLSPQVGLVSVVTLPRALQIAGEGSTEFRLRTNLRLWLSSYVPLPLINLDAVPVRSSRGRVKAAKANCVDTIVRV